MIRRVSRRVTAMYVCLWVVPAAMVVLYESGVLMEGALAGDVRGTYVVETVCILLTAVLVPLSLKVYSWAIAHRVDRVNIVRALQLYVYWNVVRTGALLVVVATGFWTYYTCVSSKGILCGLIGLVASLFCVPSMGRVKRELHIDREDEERMNEKERQA